MTDRRDFTHKRLSTLWSGPSHGYTPLPELSWEERVDQIVAAISSVAVNSSDERLQAIEDLRAMAELADRYEGCSK